MKKTSRRIERRPGAETTSRRDLPLDFAEVPRGLRRRDETRKENDFRLDRRRGREPCLISNYDSQAAREARRGRLNAKTNAISSLPCPKSREQSRPRPRKRVIEREVHAADQDCRDRINRFSAVQRDRAVQISCRIVHTVFGRDNLRYK